MKWAYFDRGGDLVYLDVETKVDMFVPPLPYRTLMLFKNPTNNDWVVADYLTGVKIGSYSTRKKGKEGCFNVEMCLQVQNALDISAKRGDIFTEVNNVRQSN